MKFVGRVFGLLCVAGLFSAYNFSAMANCTSDPSNVKAGHFCKGSVTSYECRPGCYCYGNTTYGVGSNDVAARCRNRDLTDNQAQTFELAGVFLCPADKPFSQKGAKSEDDCSDKEYCDNDEQVGRYCKSKHAMYRDCKAGCYCPGTTKQAVGQDVEVDKICGRDKNPTPLEKAKMLAADIHLCPDEFPESGSKKSKVSDCYTFLGNKKFYYGTNNCSAGTYLPKNTPRTASCHPCPSGKFCPGGQLLVSTTEDHGVYDCPSPAGTVGDGKNSCILTCEAGKYYRGSTKSCTGCPSNRACKGISFTVSTNVEDLDKDHGLTVCVPNADRTDCMSASAVDVVSSASIDHEFVIENQNNLETQSYTITYQCGDGTTGTPPNQQTVAQDGDVTISADEGACAKNGYHFANEWKNGNDTITAGQHYDQWINENVTLVAQWDDDTTTTDTISYNCGEGTGNPESQTVQNNGNVTVHPSSECQRDGYTFTKWISGNEYFVAGDTISSWTYGSISLTPYWQEDTGADNGGNNGGGSGGADVVTGTLIPVAAGYYIPAGGTQAVSCVNNSNISMTQFCPGGNWLTGQSTPQGVFNCLPNGVANSDHKSCNVVLNTIDLTDGIVDDGYCWLLDDTDEYIYCVLGGATDAAQ